jgi:hypothetical protein
MPLPPEEVLAKLLDATEEAKVATREAHEVHKSLRGDIKDQHRMIVDSIVEEVTKAVAALKAEAAEDMRTAMRSEIDRLAVDWRVRLGLNDG